MCGRSPALHSQVVKIKKEDEHLGEDVRQGLSSKERLAIVNFSSHMKDVFLSSSRPAFPSPLGIKAEPGQASCGIRAKP